MRSRSPLLLALLLTLAGCAGDAAPDRPRVDLDSRDPEPRLRFYFGSYVDGDPFEAGLLARDGGDFRLDLAALPDPVRAALAAPAADGLLDKDEVAAFLEATYYDARGLPPTLDALRAEGDWADTTAWFTMDVDGVMTAARRRVSVPLSALRDALRQYRARDGRLLYPVGTAIVGEHLAGGGVVETTLMRKRADGFWDYAVYDAEGRLAPATTTEPRALRAPVQCVGCHVGQKLFEPEKSFPGPAPDGPFGPRAVHVPAALRSADVTAFFQEHARRPDTVLGLYGTLYVTGLLADRDAGRLAAEDAALLDALGL